MSSVNYLPCEGTKMLKLEGILTSPLLVCFSTNWETEVQNCSFPKASGCQNKDSHAEGLVPKSADFLLFLPTPIFYRVVDEMGSFFGNKCHKILSKRF